MQRLGQHFLKNKSVIVKIIKALDLTEGDVVIEIGPGHGELTLPLAEECKKIGCTLLAIEKDKELANGFAGTVDVIHGDVLKILGDEIKKREATSYKIVGNIPYYITGKLLRIISELEQKPERAVLMVQKEVAERISELPPRMNRLSASVQFWAEPKTIAIISKNDFSPPPKIDSAVIALKTKKGAPEVSEEKYYEAVRTLFAQPRKTILNNLATVVTKKDGQTGGTGDTKQKISSALTSLGVNPTDRPQNLSISGIIAIARNKNPDFWG